MSTKNFFSHVVAILVAAGLFAAVSLTLAADETKKEEASPVYELRTYTCNPGKLPDLHKRFRDHTMRLFEKHGMKNIGYWVPTDKPETLIYIVEHKSRDAAKQSWKAFIDDPEWKEVYKESHKNGVLVKKVESVYMTPTDYSPIK